MSNYSLRLYLLNKFIVARYVSGSGQLSTTAKQFPEGNPETRKLCAAYLNTVVLLQPASCGSYVTVTAASSVYP